MKAEEIFKEKQSSMSDAELIEEVERQISELARTGGRSHRMSVPPMIKDTDMILSELVRRYKNLSDNVTERVNEVLNEILAELPSDAESLKIWKHKSRIESFEYQSTACHYVGMVDRICRRLYRLEWNFQSLLQ